MLVAEQLALHRYYLVVHESALHQGQGWSPMTWQILEGASSIPIKLQGHELVEEWHTLQARATFHLCLTCFDCHQEVVKAANPQCGEASNFSRRRPADSRLDPVLSRVEQFNLLRLVDNHPYPANFQWRGRRYIVNPQSDWCLVQGIFWRNILGFWDYFRIY